MNHIKAHTLVPLLRPQVTCKATCSEA
jgi:hypothetical protein